MQNKNEIYYQSFLLNKTKHADKLKNENCFCCIGLSLAAEKILKKGFNCFILRIKEED